MENIFEGAKFGDKFLTRDGRKASFVKVENNGEMHELVIEDGTYISTNKHGFIDYENQVEQNDDIVSRYHEPIDEEKLDDYIKKNYMEIINTLPIPWDDCTDECIECFKIGYRKAKEE